MNPLEFLGWVVAVAVAVIILGAAIAVAIACINAGRAAGDGVEK